MASTATRRNIRSIRERESPGMTWSDAIEMFLLSRRRGIQAEGAKRKARDETIRNYRNDLKIFSDWMLDNSHTHYNHMQRADVVRFCDWVAEKNPDDFRRKRWAEASQYKVLRSIRAFFNWVELCEDCRLEQMRGWTQCLPVIPRNPRKPFVPQKNAMKKFLSSLDTRTRVGLRDFAAGNLIVDAGLRQGELRWLRMKNLKLDEDSPFILVPQEGKTNERVVWITQDCVRILKMWLRRRERFVVDGVDWVFVNQHGKKQMTTIGWAHAWRRHRILANTPGLTAHTFRHYFCTDWVRNGGDLAKLQSQTGHESLETLRIYLHLANDKAVAKEAERVSPLKNLSRKD
jgi:site-specific recombinase XerD